MCVVTSLFLRRGGSETKGSIELIQLIPLLTYHVESVM